MDYNLERPKEKCHIGLIDVAVGLVRRLFMDMADSAYVIQF